MSNLHHKVIIHQGWIVSTVQDQDQILGSQDPDLKWILKVEPIVLYEQNRTENGSGSSDLVLDPK